MKEGLRFIFQFENNRATLNTDDYKILRYIKEVKVVVFELEGRVFESSQCLSASPLDSSQMAQANFQKIMLIIPSLLKKVKAKAGKNKVSLSS